MTLPHERSLQQLSFYITTPYACGYLAHREARSLIATPQHLVDAEVYSDLIRLGFRRSGKYAYRPHCEHCSACTPVRLPVAQFTPGRSQRRAWKRHENLSVRIREPHFSAAHYALYRAYQQARHAGGGMDGDDAGQYRDFLTESNVGTVMVEFREGETLRMVSVVDNVRDGLSAVYTFYDCGVPGSAYGTFNILWLIAWCRELGLPYLYLGYWIPESRKMAYKKNFVPLQAFLDGTWKILEK